MDAASPPDGPSPAPGADAPNGLGKAFDVTTRLATSWVGLLTAYAGAVTAAVLAFRKLAEPLQGTPVWMRAALVSSLPFLALVFHTIPTLVEQRRKKRLTEISGRLQTGYFTLAPRDDEASFTRADGKHQEILRWIEQYAAPVLYLTGLSGSGKSSLLTASVLPGLARKNTLNILLRGHQDPVSLLERELQKPGIIWQKHSPETTTIRSLLERACQHIRPRRMLIVLDQFEEFVILQDRSLQKRLEQLLSSLQGEPIAGVTFLLVFRSDYRGFRPGGLIRGFLRESLFLPPVRDIAPKLIPHLITNYVTKRPRTVAELSQETALEPDAVRGCLRVLGQSDRSIVRPLDPDQQRWEISHDFLVPLLDSLVARWSVSFWRQARPWFPWIAAAMLVAAVGVISNRNRNPILELTSLGWHVHETGNALELSFVDDPPRESIEALRRIHMPLKVTIESVSGRIAVDGIRQLGVLKNLSELDLTGTNVSDVSFLKDLKNLSALRLGDTSVSDVSFLKDLKNLSALRLGDTSVSDISPLKDLKNLSTLGLGGTKVSDVSPLNDLKKLSTLRLDSTRVSDISPLKDHRNLSALDLSGTPVSDISPLKDLKNLSALDLSGTPVSDISVLKDLNNLSALDLDSTRVRDLSPLKDLMNLSTLSLGGTNVNDISPLKNLKNLSTLFLGDTQVSDVSPLKGLRNLSGLFLLNTPVSDISPLKALRNLSGLYLRNTQVSDVSPLKDLTNLSKLDLVDTKVSDLSPLKDLKNLSILH